MDVDIKSESIDVDRPSDVRCSICGNIASFKYRDHPGYQEPARFDIMYCANCDASFAFPMEVDNGIYDLIYTNILKAPGYRRYYDYALRVLEQRDPLSYLSLNEEAYWATNDFLTKFTISKKCRILEVGCGFGYLTYSISRAGYDITGLDISKEAVDNATKRYGPHYVCADINDYVNRNKKQYDVVILTEIIEHIPDIVAFMKSLDGVVKDDGFIFLTTPNKTAYEDDIIWETDLPPIHLWWLSKTSVGKIAEIVGRRAIFTDFSTYNRSHPIRRHRIASDTPTRKATFSPDNKLLLTEDPHREKSRFSRGFKMLKLKLLSKLLCRFSSRKFDGVERYTLCAVLLKNKVE